ncbi:cbb3-type cytochrome C oxidase subunit 3 [Thioclava sediminum]|uniref:Cbb3-type cytochrome C oxidase subunit 3 n=1 Tax=Thioclava sediminum TaxID=1915319 RepID=A0ABX3MWQ0_9RHOB|nr:cbb3-type cytochrome c oxidase subunit 3 [Thioclava sediminum]OOY24100.1 cbb3-type cytochrome C oxidase subunit 3 [Thioclava sediminum]
MDYHIFREFADSWFLIFMFVFFLAVVAWVFRPGSRKTYEDTSEIPFRHEDKPANASEAGESRSPKD